VANGPAQVFSYTLLLTFIGPENRGRGMRVFDDDDMVDIKGHYPVEGDVGEVPTNSKPQTELIENA
jgi:SHS family lactate transporter-like MFS transporter